MDIEERTVTLKATKQRKEKEEVSPLTEPGECGNWYIKLAGGHYYTCRICYTQGPTGYPYEECIQLPD